MTLAGASGSLSGVAVGISRASAHGLVSFCRETRETMPGVILASSHHIGSPPPLGLGEPKIVRGFGWKLHSARLPRFRDRN